VQEHEPNVNRVDLNVALAIERRQREQPGERAEDAGLQLTDQRLAGPLIGIPQN